MPRVTSITAAPMRWRASVSVRSPQVSKLNVEPSHTSARSVLKADSTDPMETFFTSSTVGFDSVRFGSVRFVGGHTPAATSRKVTPFPVPFPVERKE